MLLDNFSVKTRVYTVIIDKESDNSVYFIDDMTFLAIYTHELDKTTLVNCASVPCCVGQVIITRKILAKCERTLQHAQQCCRNLYTHNSYHENITIHLTLTVKYHNITEVLQSKLTPWNTILSGEANSRSATQEIPHLLWNMKVHHPVHSISSLDHILRKINPVHFYTPFLEDSL